MDNNQLLNEAIGHIRGTVETLRQKVDVLENNLNIQAASLTAFKNRQERIARQQRWGGKGGGI